MALSNSATTETQPVDVEAAQPPAATAVEAAPQKRMRKRPATAESRPDAHEPERRAKATAAPAPNKSEIVLKKLRTANGATIAQLMQATGWQAHSVRGFLSGTVKKKLNLDLLSEVGKDGQRRYRIMPASEG